MTQSLKSSFELDHFYGPQVHILNNIYLNTQLARLCSPETFQPEINRLVEILYGQLVIEVLNQEFQAEKVETKTRMIDAHPTALLKTEILDRAQKAVVVNLARAGTYPSHICYNALHYGLQPQNIRQDHIFAARVTNSSHQVTGSDFGAMKIGGDIDNAYVLIPDPMGATGNTIISAVDHYKRHVKGTPKKFIALHLIVTPEYLKRVLTTHPEVVIYSLRLDRGLSDQAVLSEPPGKLWAQERGLNDKDYIVPGGGGFGEIMNNSFV